METVFKGDTSIVTKQSGGCWCQCICGCGCGEFSSYIVGSTNAMFLGEIKADQLIFLH